jgi:hypothetical protein
VSSVYKASTNQAAAFSSTGRCDDVSATLTQKEGGQWEKISCNWPECTKTFTRQPDLDRHRDTIHLKTKQFWCTTPGCKRSESYAGLKRPFLRKDKRDDHVRRAHKAASGRNGSCTFLANAVDTNYLAGLEGYANDSRPMAANGFPSESNGVSGGLNSAGLTSPDGLTGVEGLASIGGLASANGITSDGGLINVEGFANVDELTNSGRLTNVNELTNGGALTSVDELTSFDELTVIDGLAGVEGLTNVNGLIGVGGLASVDGFTNFDGLPGVEGFTNEELTNVNGLTDVGGTHQCRSSGCLWPQCHWDIDYGYGLDWFADNSTFTQ